MFKGIKMTWNEVFGHGFSLAVRSLVFEVADVRNSWAHQESSASDDTARALDSMERLLEAFGDTENRRSIKMLRRWLMRQKVAAAVPNVVLMSIPASDIEIGGARFLADVRTSA